MDKCLHTLQVSKPCPYIGLYCFIFKNAKFPVKSWMAWYLLQMIYWVCWLWLCVHVSADVSINLKFPHTGSCWEIPVLKSLNILKLLKFYNRNTRTRSKICSKLTIKRPERRSGVFIVHFEHISHFVLVFLLLTLNM